MFGISGGSAGGTVQPFNPSVTVNATTTVSSGGSPQDWHGRASIKRRADGVLVLCYRRGSIHFVNDGALYIRFSDDNGATWTASNTTLGGAAVVGFPMNPSTLSAGEDAGEPWLYLAPNGDLVLHMWRVDYSVTTNGTWQSRSTDGGETWGPSEQVTFGIAGISDNRVFATDDDFVWDRVIYAGARVYVDVDGVPASSILIKSTDNGASWSKVSTIMDTTEGAGAPSAGGASEVGLEYLGNNTIIAMLRDHPHINSYQRVSTDMGATWGTLTSVTSAVGPAGRQRVYTRSHLQGLDGWWKDPVLFMVHFVHQDPGDPDSQDRRNAISISPDRGATWDGPHYLNSTTQDGGYGDMFWRSGNAYSVVSYAGTHNVASLIQYDVTVTGL